MPRRDVIANLRTIPGTATACATYQFKRFLFPFCLIFMRDRDTAERRRFRRFGKLVNQGKSSFYNDRAYMPVDRRVKISFNGVSTNDNGVVNGSSRIINLNSFLSRAETMTGNFGIIYFVRLPRTLLRSKLKEGRRERSYVRANPFISSR